MPIITTAGLYFVAAIPGVVVVEVLFSIPGVGSMIIDAVSLRDIGVVQATTMLIGAMAITMSLLVDVTYHLLDPRTRGSQRSSTRAIPAQTSGGGEENPSDA
jgi:peptide/nickel transport system permease protein